MFLQISQNSQENTKKIFHYRCLLVNSAKFLITPFLKNPSNGCFCVNTRPVYFPNTTFCLFKNDVAHFFLKTSSEDVWVGWIYLSWSRRFENVFIKTNVCWVVTYWHDDRKQMFSRDFNNNFLRRPNEQMWMVISKWCEMHNVGFEKNFGRFVANLLWLSSKKKISLLRYRKVKSILLFNI